MGRYAGWSNNGMGAASPVEGSGCVAPSSNEGSNTQAPPSSTTNTNNIGGSSSPAAGCKETEERVDLDEKNAIAAAVQSATELVPLPDRLRPMTSINGEEHEDNQTTMSEITLPQVRGTLYPFVPPIPEESLKAASPLNDRKQHPKMMKIDEENRAMDETGDVGIVEKRQHDPTRVTVVSLPIRTTSTEDGVRVSPGSQGPGAYSVAQNQSTHRAPALVGAIAVGGPDVSSEEGSPEEEEEGRASLHSRSIALSLYSSSTLTDLVEADLVPEDDSDSVFMAEAVIPPRKLLLVSLTVFATVIAATGIALAVNFSTNRPKSGPEVTVTAVAKEELLNTRDFALNQLYAFSNEPVAVLSTLERFIRNGLFPNDLGVGDRDAFLAMVFSMRNEYDFDAIYYGSEEGMFMGYGNRSLGTYREPGNSYRVDDPDMQKYYKACVDQESGYPVNCTHALGSQYVQCVDNCSLSLCPDEGPKEPCDASPQDCSEVQKWCPTYELKEVTEDELGLLGFVPRTYHCFESSGVFSQEVGEIHHHGHPGDCVYGDGVTLVNRSIEGDYHYCQGSSCDDVFVGGFRSRDYDPRLRSWYKLTKQGQKPTWSPPYILFSGNQALGITYSIPHYVNDDSGRHIFKGVLGVFYELTDIGAVLEKEIGLQAGQHVVIYEAAEPNYFVASSTGRPPLQSVSKEDPSIPCPKGDGNSKACVEQRASMEMLQGYPFDDLLKRAYFKQNELGYPPDSVEVVDIDKSEVHLSLWSSYKPSNHPEWIVLVMSVKGTT